MAFKSILAFLGIIICIFAPSWYGIRCQCLRLVLLEQPRESGAGRRRAAGVVTRPPDHIRRQKSSQEKQDARKKSV